MSSTEHPDLETRRGFAMTSQETIVSMRWDTYFADLRKMVEAGRARNDPTLAIAVSVDALDALLTAAEARESVGGITEARLRATLQEVAAAPEKELAPPLAARSFGRRPIVVETTETREHNTEAAAYIEDDPEAWASWIDALERYVPQLPALAQHIGEEAGAFQVIGGSILAYLADRRGLYLTRAATLRSTSRDSEVAVHTWTGDPADQIAELLTGKMVQVAGNLYRLSPVSGPEPADDPCACGHRKGDHRRNRCLAFLRDLDRHTACPCTERYASVEL